MERAASFTYKIAVISSGHSRGSNLIAMFKYWQKHNIPANIALAVFTLSDSPAYHIAKELGIDTVVIPARDVCLFETELRRLCSVYGIDLIALAGFLKLLSDEFINTIGIPVLNIHPALLPQYGGKGMYGMAVHKAVYEAGEKLSGATVHLVDSHYDQGKIIAQSAIEISDCDSPEAIAAKVLSVEHQLYAPSIYSFLTQSIT